MLKYFSGLNLNLSYPGYAIEVPDFSLNTIDYKYDCIYMAKFESVSYTHLTLPTNSRV